MYLAVAIGKDEVHIVDVLVGRDSQFVTSSDNKRHHFLDYSKKRYFVKPRDNENKKNNSSSVFRLSLIHI